MKEWGIYVFPWATMGSNMKNVKKIGFFQDESRYMCGYYNGLNVILVWYLHDLWWSMCFAPDKYQVCEIPMWHSNINGTFMEPGQMKIGMILRCHKMKTLFGCMMTGVLRWLCWMIIEEYMLGCWMDECIWLKSIPCSMWWCLKMVQMGCKMDFDGLMGCKKLEIFFQWVTNSF